LGVIRNARELGYTTYIPEHGTGKAFGANILSLEPRNIRNIVRDEFPLARIVGVARDVCCIFKDLCASNCCISEKKDIN